MKFHLMHCVPHPRMHGLYGYREVIQSIEWGLKELGQSVTYALNNFDPESINIIFGAQVLPIGVLEKLPGNTIIYNLEQIRGSSKDQIRPEVHFYSNKFQVWEYSPSNLLAWELMGAKNVQVVPVAYAPTLTRIPKPHTQDIDVLIYGLTGKKRLEIFHQLSNAGISTIFASGFYGEARDQLIARSKVVLNINLYDFTRIFEIVRVSYLLANKKAVIATIDPNTYIEPEFLEAAKFISPDKVVEICIHFLESDMERNVLEQKGFNTFAQRDIRVILKAALGI
ncbi:hypothetical protein [Polynucleobacter sp. UK-FUSCHL-C3]|uniref:Glycosyltransferase family 1 protein n=1 Tax=Polynucleobacter sp. UK-FUSCHL-C3 TaxID=2955208 RepID=A0AAU8A216_9BURK